MKQLFIAIVACMLSVLMMRADEVRTLEIELTEACTLAQKLEEHNMLEVDSLVVRGSMGIADCQALVAVTRQLWSSTQTTERPFLRARSSSDIGSRDMTESPPLRTPHFCGVRT